MPRPNKSETFPADSKTAHFIQSRRPADWHSAPEARRPISRRPPDSPSYQVLKKNQSWPSAGGSGTLESRNNTTAR